MSSSGGGHKPELLPLFSFVSNILHGVHGDHGVHISFKQLLIAFVGSVIIFFVISPQQSIDNFGLVIFLSPIWVPVILFRASISRFVQMVRAEFFAKQEYVLLEVRIPRDVTKSPLAMETFFSNMNIGSGETTWYKKFIQGSSRPSWSFEIVSLGGRVHLYIWTRTGYRRLVETFLYAQYPDIEIIEAEDYSRLVDPSEHGYDMFACEYALKKSDAYPIKTYVDYKMEPGDKPEETVDPLAQIIETVGALGPGEQFWIQIIVRTHKLEKYKGIKNAKGGQYKWTDVIKEAVEEIRTQTVRKTSFTDPVTGETSERESFPNPSKGQSEGIAAIERKASKQVFDVGIRTVYLGESSSFHGIMIPAQLNLFKPYANDLANFLSVQSVWTAAYNDYPWEDPGGRHKHHFNHEAIQMYRRRAYFFDPYQGNWMVLSTEELASLYHIPSAAVTTPNLPRIQSATTGAPPNLPL